MAAATGKACALGSLLASSSSSRSSPSSCIAGGGGCGGGSGYASGRNGIAGSVVGGVRGLSLSKSSGASWRQGQGRRCAGVAPAGIRASAAVVADAPPVPRLKRIYTEKVVPALKEEFNYTNPQEIPYLKKIVVNCGVGEAAQNAKSLESSVRDLSLVTGQKPVTTRAKKAIAGFKLREGVPVGVCLTLRGGVMYSFLDRLVNLALPRTRDFQGVNLYSFDGKGNYTLGLPEQSVFPEIRFENIDKERGMDVNIVTSAKNDNEGQKLLALLGMPFKDSATGGIATLTKKRKGGGAFKGGKPRKAVKPPKPQKKKK